MAAVTSASATALATALLGPPEPSAVALALALAEAGPPLPSEVAEAEAEALEEACRDRSKGPPVSLNLPTMFQMYGCNSRHGVYLRCGGKLLFRRLLMSKFSIQTELQRLVATEQAVVARVRQYCCKHNSPGRQAGDAQL